MTNKLALLKAAQIARINLSSEEQDKLVGEIDEVLKAFSKIDEFKESVQESQPLKSRKFRADKVEKCEIDPFSNSILVKDRKFIGPKLVD